MNGSRTAAALWLVCAVALGAPAASAGTVREWRSAIVFRVGDIEAVDADDGHLAAFVRDIRNDGGFSPPVRTLIGPAVRNPGLSGLGDEAWIECAIMAPVRPGPLTWVWVLPVENRDEFMSQFARQGLAEYEGMDGVTVLRELDADGETRTWHLEWLPGGAALFGPEREAVAAARAEYLENGAKRGLLADGPRRTLEPDIMLRLDPDRLASWQESEPGVYWWRELVELLARDLIGFWNPNPARVRLIRTLAEDLAVWPRTIGPVTASLWFERAGIEWRVEARGGEPPSARPSELEVMRRLPGSAAFAYAVPVSAESFRNLAGRVGALLLDAAGGVAAADAREAASRLEALLARAGPKQFAAAWISPPSGRPELGPSRLLVSKWENPEALDAVWPFLLNAVGNDAAVAQAFSQIGWKASLEADGEAGAALVIRSSVAEAGERFIDSRYFASRSGAWLAIAGGDAPPDDVEAEAAAAHWAALAAEAAAANGEGAPGVREAFTRMRMDGAAFAWYLDPVRFIQLALLASADWRPAAPDRPEPESARIAREMLGFGRTDGMGAVGEAENGVWRCNGGASWRTLSRLAAALGVTESVGF